MELKDSLKLLPECPGIYFMKNSLGTVIYVGKAKNLKARVSQYFQKRKDNSPKINDMIQHICSFEYIKTETELDAFLMECRTIKELKPKYNRQLKNHKGYMYIRLSINEDYPMLSKATKNKKDHSLYFGPFTSEGSVDNTIEFIKDYFPIRKCSTGAMSRYSSGCLNFHLGACLGPCRANDVREEYAKHINKIIQFLEGKDYAPVKLLHMKIKSAANNLEFEKAIKFRDQLRGIRHVLNKQRVIKVSRLGRNIIAAEKCGENLVKLFFIKGNRLLHTELIDLANYGNSPGEELRNLAINCFKVDKKNKDNVLKQEDIDEAQIIYSYIKNKSNGIRSLNIPSSRIDGLNYGKMVKSLFWE